MARNQFREPDLEELDTQINDSMGALLAAVVRTLQRREVIEQGLDARWIGMLIHAALDAAYAETADLADAEATDLVAPLFRVLLNGLEPRAASDA